jgi:hypothetical protein
MRIVQVALMALVVGLVGQISNVEAQTKKKSDKSEPTTNSVGSYPRCEGTLFLVSDSGSGPLCQRRDGKVCQVTPDTGGKAYFANCK